MKKIVVALLLLCATVTLNTQNANAAIPMQNQTETVTTAQESNMTQAEVTPMTKAEKKVAKKAQRKAMGGKSQLVALILCFFLGIFGIHRFYLGYIWQGVVQLLTGGGLGIWVLIDFIRIITGGLTPKDGSYDSTL